MLHSIPARQKLLVMIAVMSGLFLFALDQTIIAAALTKIVEDFNSFSSLGFIVTAYLLASTVTVPIAGKLSDLLGRRPVLLAGVIVFTIGSLLSGISQNIGELIAFRALQGFGGGIIIANAFTIVGDLFSPRERGKWQGIFGAVFGLASVVGPLLGGFLTDEHMLFGYTTDWRWTFFINVPVGVFSAIVIAKYCPNIKHEKKPVIDYSGAAALTVALSTLVLAVDNTETVFKFLVDRGVGIGLIQASLYILAALSTALFVFIESRAAQPIIPLNFFKNRNFTTIIIAALLFGAAFLGSILYLTHFNQQVFEADATTAGLMLLPMIGGLTLTSAIIGQLVSRTGKYKSFIVGGFSVAAIGVFALSSLGPDSSYIQEAIIMVFIGIGLGSGMPILNLAVQNEFEQKDLGVATASNQLFRNLGSTIGTALFSGILTVGVTSSIVTVQDGAYVQAVKQSPSASQRLPEELDANAVLQLNSQRATISDQAVSSINKSPLSPQAKDRKISEFKQDQNEFSAVVIGAFTASLHKIFFAASGLMAIAAVVILLFLRERELRDGSSPGLSE